MAREIKPSHKAHPLYHSDKLPPTSIEEAAVTQHQAALQIAASQVISGELAPARIAGSTPTTGQVPTVQGDGSVDWAAIPVGGAHTLGSHSDVNAPAPTDNQSLTWDAATSKWVPETVAGGSTPLASATVTGTVKTDVTEADPKVYTKATADTLLAAKQALLAQGVVQKVTGSLADNAEETGTIVLGKNGLILKVVTDRACWVRLYGTAAERTADATRLITADPADGVPVLADLIFTVGNLTISTAPLIGYANRDGTVVTSLYYSIINKSGSTSTVTVDATRLTLET